MGCYHVGLSTHGLSGYYFAVLEHDCRIAEDKIHCSGDVGVSVELPVGVGVECVLIGINAAAVNYGLVGSDAKCHCLVLLWPGRVLDPDVLGDESITNSSCIGNDPLVKLSLSVVYFIEQHKQNMTVSFHYS